MTDPCYSMALRLLGRRAYSSHKIREKLINFFSAQEVEHCINRLVEKKYLDDTAYLNAKWEKGKKQGLSQNMRIRKLANEGFEQNNLKEVFRENAEDEDEVTNALEYTLQRKKSLLSKLNDPKTKDRIFRHLIYKGFSLTTINKVWKILCTLNN